MFLIHLCEPCNVEEITTQIDPKYKCPKCGLLTEDRWIDEEKEYESWVLRESINALFFLTWEGFIVTTPTCPYCESIVNLPNMKDDLTHCEFCNDYVYCSEDGKRKSLYNIQLTMNMDLP